MPLRQAPDDAAGFDGGIGAELFEVGVASGIDELTAGGFARLALLEAAAPGSARPGPTFGFAPAHAAASTMPDKMNVRARRMSGP